MKIKYPDGNKPKGFAVLDENGKLDPDILPGGGCEIIIIEKKDGEWQNSPKSPAEIVGLIESGTLVKIFMKLGTESYNFEYDECIINRVGSDGDGGNMVELFTLKTTGTPLTLAPKSVFYINDNSTIGMTVDPTA